MQYLPSSVIQRTFRNKYRLIVKFQHHMIPLGCCPPRWSSFTCRVEYWIDLYNDDRQTHLDNKAVAFLVISSKDKTVCYTSLTSSWHTECYLKYGSSGQRDQVRTKKALVKVSLQPFHKLQVASFIAADSFGPSLICLPICWVAFMTQMKYISYSLCMTTCALTVYFDFHQNLHYRNLTWSPNALNTRPITRKVGISNSFINLWIAQLVNWFIILVRGFLLACIMLWKVVCKLI